MAVKKSDTIMLKKLKKQVRMLEKKEEAAKNKLHAALAKLRKLNKTYKDKLNRKVRMMKDKIAKAQSSTYAMAAAHLERPTAERH